MKKKILIIGGGFTGFRSALSALRYSKMHRWEDQIEITLISLTSHLHIPVDADEIFPTGSPINLDDYLSQSGIRFMLAKVEVVRPENNSLMVKTALGLRKIYYDHLILAAGSITKPVDSVLETHGFQLDMREDEARLFDHVHQIVKRDFSKPGDHNLVFAGGMINFPEMVKSVILDLSNKAGKVFESTIIGKPSQSPHRYEGLETDTSHIIDATLTGYCDGHFQTDTKRTLLANTLLWIPNYKASPLTRFFGSEKDAIGRLKVSAFGKLDGYRNVSVAGFAAWHSDLKWPNLHRHQVGGREAGEEAVKTLLSITTADLSTFSGVKNHFSEVVNSTNFYASS